MNELHRIKRMKIHTDALNYCLDCIRINVYYDVVNGIRGNLGAQNIKEVVQFGVLENDRGL